MGAYFAQHARNTPANDGKKEVMLTVGGVDGGDVRRVLRVNSDGSLAIGGSNGMSIPENDYQAFTYVGSTNNIHTITFKSGGAIGTVVATLTFTYVGSGAADDDDIATITLT